jgi:acetyltransferase-like isoleucine patch superfamily enzyme
MSDQPKNPPPRNVLDRLIRRFNQAAHVLAVLILYVVASTAAGLALAPALWFLRALGPWALARSPYLRWPLAGMILGQSFFIAGFALLVVVPVYNLALPTRVRPFKGGYFTIAALPWYVHNALFYLVRFTFLPFVTTTPFGVWFLRAMGMRIGRRVRIFTEYISDPRLITLEDDVVLGGSVRIFAHYGGGGHLVIAPVRIGAGATIGVNVTVMGDVVVGPGALILPHSVLIPGSRVGAEEIWGGTPAHRLDPSEFERLKQEIRVGA